MSKILDSLEPDFRALVVPLLVELETMGIKCVGTSGRRTITEQDKLYAIGRTIKGEGATTSMPMGRIVTKAKGGQSPHNFGLALDVCPINPRDGSLWWNAPDDVWNVIHSVAEQKGYLDSGYDWKFYDRPHIEDPNWKVAKADWLAGKLKVV